MLQQRASAFGVSVEVLMRRCVGVDVWVIGGTIEGHSLDISTIRDTAGEMYRQRAEL